LRNVFSWRRLASFSRQSFINNSDISSDQNASSLSRTKNKKDDRCQATTLENISIGLYET
jgi:hypothetical protein